MATEELFTDRLSDYLDGEELSATERAAIEAHLATCEACRTTLAELEEVAARASSLPNRAPVGNLWPGVAERLTPPSAVLPFPRPLHRRFSFTLPQLVAAGLALMVLSGGLVWVARLGDPRASLPTAGAQVPPTTELQVVEHEELSPIPRVAFADANYDKAVADLEKVLEDNRSRLDPQTVQILEENLQTIDQAIEQSRKALRADPANVYLNGHFAASRNRKLALLRRASALAMAQDSGGGS
jgi:tetratricopeptide (TPR) repeat protein